MSKRASNNVEEAKEPKQVKEAKEGERFMLDEWLERANSKLSAMGSSLKVKFNIPANATPAGEPMSHLTDGGANGGIITHVTLLRGKLQICFLAPWKDLYVSIMLIGGLKGFLEEGIIKSQTAFLNLVCPNLKGIETGVPSGGVPWSVSRSDQADAEGYWTFTMETMGRNIELQLPGFITQDSWVNGSGFEPPEPVAAAKGETGDEQ